MIFNVNVFQRIDKNINFMNTNKPVKIHIIICVSKQLCLFFNRKNDHYWPNFTVAINDDVKIFG